MTEATRIAVDTSKHVFTLHGVDASGRAVLRRNLRRAEFLAFFARLAPVEVAMEACGGSHHWGRALMGMGHDVRLVPAQYVKPFVQRGKNDAADAEAICTAAWQPGIGPIGALSLLHRVDPRHFQSGRHFAAWLGLTPRDKSTGGKQRLGGISRAGDERLRQLLVLGATTVIQHAKPGNRSAWLTSLLARKPRKLAAVALANKMARVAWAMMMRGTAFRQPEAPAMLAAA